MDKTSIHSKAINAAKWSSATELIAKMVTPVSNMVLARLLVPEAFGVVATVTMIISFADMFTDAGFQKYLVQHEFKDEQERFRNADVAFWTNLGISVLLWLVIIMFRERIAAMVGNPGLGNVVAIACVQLLLTSFSSIQMALYRRDFDFRTLFLVRMISICLPFAVTIPLAFLGFSYWALIIGIITRRLFTAVVLTIKSKWKPRLFYSIEILKKMLSFSIWTLVEAISVWTVSWIDIFIIGTVLNQYYLGLFKTSITMVNTLIALINASILPVLFSTLSRLHSNDVVFNQTYFKTQRMVSILLFPMGMGVFLYSDLATRILLGTQWKEASAVIGIWALTSALVVVFGNFCNEVYRSKGRPKLSFLAQALHLVVLVPTILIS